MTNTDPRFAPRRADLPYLRRRRRPGAAAPAISFDRPGRRPGASATVPPPPLAAAPAAAAPPPVASLVAPPGSSASTSLDLDAAAENTAPSAAAGPATVRPPAEPRRRTRPDARVRAGRRVILTVGEPTVTLTRLQSGIGTLHFEAACSDEVGDLRLGAVYQLAAGLSSTVALPRRRLGPPDSRRPVLVAGRDQFDTVAVDLRQSRELTRLAILAFSESRSALRWGGTLIVETFGGARVELPLETLRDGQVAVLMSLYNVRGEFVLRAEMQTLDGDLRDACRAYGYDRITWLDARTPVD